MGYYTFYGLELFGTKTEVNHEKEIGAFVGDSGLFNTDQKWYHHEEDMKEYSKQHKELIFKLSGAGEDPGDLWVKYFQNGKTQECRGRIKYDPFDARKLT